MQLLPLQKIQYWLQIYTFERPYQNLGHITPEAFENNVLNRYSKVVVA